MAILFIIFIAIIGALFYGDSSLLVAILKFAGAAILIFGIMAIMAYCPWLLLVIIVLAIFVGVDENGIHHTLWLLIRQAIM